MTNTIGELPAVKRYLNRIGAEMRTLFGAVVAEEVHGYERVIDSLKFDRAGVVRAPEGLEPTDEEQEEIAEAFEGLALPRQESVQALANGSLPDAIRNATTEDTFIFRNRKKQIRFVQVRVDLPDGGKRYVPWTHWDDGTWRAVEPEEGMPIYGLEEVEPGSRVFLHEGAKAAAAAQKIAKDSTHPFHTDFMTGVHVGWVGGAHRLERTLWRELTRLPSELVIVQDNDFLGKVNTPKIAKKFACPVYRIEFDGQWPNSWDFADPIPDHFRLESGIYNGPTLASMMEACDWATEMVSVEGSERLVPKIKEEFAATWVRIQTTRQYAHLSRPDVTLDREQFNVKVRPFSHAPDTERLFTGMAGNICDRATFLPSKPSGLLLVDGARCLNQYVDRRLQAIEGDCEPFHSFMEYLLPHEEERREIIRWVATLYAQPSSRMSYGLLLLSKLQGVGKSTLLEIMGTLIGKQHTSYPGDSLIQGQFNSWVVNKRLVVVHEIYAGRSWAAYQKLKSLITDDSIEANAKHVANYTVPNCAHFAAASNSLEALRMEHDDRRWFVPTLPEKKYHDYAGLFAWIEAGGIHHLAHELLGRDDYVGRGESAPKTMAKAALIDQSMPSEERLALMACDRLSPDECLDISDLWLWLGDKAKGGHFITPQRIVALLKDSDYLVHPSRMLGPRKRQLVWGRGTDTDAIAPEGTAPEAEARAFLSRLKNPETIFNSTDTIM